jgi:hypothetical protein
VAELGYAYSVKWEESRGDDRYRRGLYTHLQRTVPYPMLTTFDGPDSTVACVRRERSLSPLQPLTTLNDPVFVEAAVALGTQCAAQPDDAATRLDGLFRRCVARSPGPEEQTQMLAFLERQRARYAQDPAAARALVGEASDAQVLVTQAAWAALARVVLNLGEFLTRS